MEGPREDANVENVSLKTLQVGPPTTARVSSSWTATTTTPTDSSSASVSRGNDHPTGSMPTPASLGGSEKNSKDILAQWRLERDQQKGRNKLGDIMSLENSRINKGSESDKGTSDGKNKEGTLVKAVESSKEISNSSKNVKRQSQSQRAPPTGGNDDFLDAIIHSHSLNAIDDNADDGDQLSVDLELSSAITNNTNGNYQNANANANHTNTQQHHRDGNSITTTPTTNTALNTMGMNRLSNRHEGSLGVTSLNVRLFRPIKENQNNDPHSPDGNSNGTDDEHEHEMMHQEDVSLITQDTELQNIMRPLDANRLMEAIEREQLVRRGDHNGRGLRNANGNAHRNLNLNLNRQSLSSLHSKGVQDAISSLQSSLERSRMVRNEQDQELLQQKEVIERLQRENTVLMNDRRKEKSVFTDSLKTLLEEVHKIDAMLCEDAASQMSISSNFSKDLDSMEGVLGVVKSLARSSIPVLLERMEENKQSAENTQKYLEKYRKQLEDVKLQISQKEEQQRTLSSQLQTEQNELARVRGEVEENSTQLLQTSSQLEAKLEESMKADNDLIRVNIELGQKRVEFKEIERLCEDRIQSAYAMECSAQARLEAASEKEKEIKSLDDAAIKKYEDAKAVEKAVAVKREELESDRLAWEAQLQLKSEQLSHQSRSLEEREEEMKAMAATLESNKTGCDAEYVRMKTVRNDLLEKESQIDERLKMADEKEAAIKAESEQLEIRKAAVEEAKVRIEHDVKKFKADKLSSMEEIERRNLALRKQQDELDEERDQCLARLKALDNGEVQLRFDRKEFSSKVTKFKNTVKAAKDEASRKKAALRRTESELEERTSILDQDRAGFEKLREDYISKEAELVSISKKCKSLKQLKMDLTKEQEFLEKKIELARAEYNNLAKSCADKREEIESLVQKVRRWITFMTFCTHICISYY